jgi:broad specificity phosphatase PhoE
VNGDPGIACPLTPAGREQARALGAALAGERLDLVVVTEFERVRETAEVAVGARELPLLVVAELNDPRYGDFEGGPLDAYREWAWGRGPLDAPPGGEHRGELATRYARGFRTLLDRPEETILLVTHSLPLRYVLDAAEGRPPAAKVGMVEYATVARLERAELERAVHVLETWAAAPAFGE